jgi:hypothetical protein
MGNTLLAVFAILALGADSGPSLEPAQSLEVLPVFYVPKGERPPSAAQKESLADHLKLCRSRYRTMLGGRDTFPIAEGAPRVVRSNATLTELKALPEDAAPHIAADLLAEYKFNRFDCPYVYVAVVMNPKANWPAGGARPLNGGFNTGGGIVILSSSGLDGSPNFQSTLQHEIGHGFGLLHVDAYDYDMGTNASIMSYNPAHHTNGLTPSATPGRLIPEDIRGLALNRRAFPNLKFDPARDIPRDYTLAKIGWLGPMNIPGQPPYAPSVATPSGAEFGSSINAIVGSRIEPSVDAATVPGTQTFNSKSMWQSGPSPTGWVMAEVTFPATVTLTRVGIHSQHSARHHAADGLRIEYQRRDGFALATEQALDSVDQIVSFRPGTSRVWHIFLHAADGQKVVVRGLRFFTKNGEIVPPPVPFGY